MVRTWVMLACLGLLLVNVSVDAGAKKSDTEVKVSATASKIGTNGSQTVEVTLAINPGWHIYANPVENEDLGPSQTFVSVNAGTKPASVKVVYPKGDLKQDKIVGDYRIYKNKVTIQAQVQRAAGDTSPLDVSVRIQACDKTRCLLPATVKVNLP